MRNRPAADKFFAHPDDQASAVLTPAKATPFGGALARDLDGACAPRSCAPIGTRRAPFDFACGCIELGAGFDLGAAAGPAHYRSSGDMSVAKRKQHNPPAVRRFG